MPAARLITLTNLLTFNCVLMRSHGIFQYCAMMPQHSSPVWVPLGTVHPVPQVWRQITMRAHEIPRPPLHPKIDENKRPGLDIRNMLNSILI